MEAAAAALAAFPDLTVVVEHTGWPLAQDPEHAAVWRNGMTRLAGLGPRVHCKLSGLAMTLHRIDVASFRPWVAHSLEVFGPARYFFASNFPVDGMFGSYDDLYGTYAQLVDELAAPARDALFAANAARIEPAGRPVETSGGGAALGPVGEQVGRGCGGGGEDGGPGSELLRERVGQAERRRVRAEQYARHHGAAGAQPGAAADRAGDGEDDAGEFPAPAETGGRIAADEAGRDDGCSGYRCHGQHATPPPGHHRRAQSRP